MYPTPKLAVVIACVNGLPWIDECLQSLERQSGSIGAEIIVANCCHDGTPEHIRKHFPRVRLLDFQRRLGIPELRARGVAESTADIICIIEDHCMVRENWFREILKAHDSEYLVTGGPVENGATDRLVDWAVFLCEYSSLMPPVEAREVHCIAGNNAAYKREAFAAVKADTLKNSWEYFHHKEMARAGIKFLSVPAMVLDHKKKFGFFYFLSQRFHYSRSFAGMRREEIPVSRRLMYAFISPLLIPLMLYRIGRDVMLKRRQRLMFLLTLPLQIPFLISYSLGEGIGYLFGGGDSLVKVE